MRLHWSWTRTSSIRTRSFYYCLHTTSPRSAIASPTVCSWRSVRGDPAKLRQGSALSYRQYSTGPTLDSVSPSNSSPSPNNSPVEEATDDKATSEKLRRVLRKVPFPVVVVSTASPNDPSIRRGITVSSFTSISLQPIPLVAFCVKLPSRASSVLHESGQFVVQFLSSDQIAHSVAFSSSVPPPPAVKASLSGTGSVTSPSSNSETRDHGSDSKSSRSKAPQDNDIENLVSEASRQTLIESNTQKSSTGLSSSSSSASKSLEADPDPFEVLGYRTDPETKLPVLLNTLGALRCRKHQVMVVGDHEMWIGHVEKVLHGEIPDEQEPLLYHDRSYRRVGRRIL
ncbi:flavin reductase like domain-containing protein [Mortierella sp. GBAus27b]|nr:flavin reductase like domain-containing protein [Mortierella sp. GBAus27b]